jgi:hypothetical protein
MLPAMAFLTAVEITIIDFKLKFNNALKPPAITGRNIQHYSSDGLIYGRILIRS